MKVMSLLLLLAAVSCGCDNPAPAPGSGVSSSTAGAGAAPRDCAGLAAHWRDVWLAEKRPGLERRTQHAAERAVAAWTRGCAAVSAAPPSAADIESLRGTKSLTALAAVDTTASKGTLAVLLQTAKDAARKTESAFAASPSTGVLECEDALVDAEFCGDDVDRASVKSAAKSKDDGACTALAVLLAKKCAQ